MPRRYKPKLKKLKLIVKTSFSYREVIKKLGLTESGSSYIYIKKLIVEYNLDTSHFLGQSVRKLSSGYFKVPIEKYLNNQNKTTSWKLKIRLIKEGYFTEKCSMCDKVTWLGNKLPLELDHIDGNKFNNNINNLRLLCPNCHYFTPTCKTKNRKSARMV